MASNISSDSDIEVIEDKYDIEIDLNSDSGSDLVITSIQIQSDESESQTGDNAFVRLTPNTDFSNENSYNFFETNGPRYPPSTNADPLTYFDLFFTEALFKTMVTETNRYAQQFLASSVSIKPKSRARLWKPVSVTEMKAFVAVLLEMGITRRPNMYSYWTKNSRQIPWFGKMFARDRFQLILKFFHMVDSNTLFQPDHPNYDPCAKFSFIVDHANNIFQRYYVPHQQLCIDKSLVGTHCQSAIKLYRFWMLCDSVTNYCLAFYCYQGAKSTEDTEEIKTNGLGFTVVKKLLKLGNYLNKGYHLYTDNFYTSVHLAKWLLQNSTYITGTIRRNRKDLPQEAKSADVGEPNFFKNEEMFICSYRDNKSKKAPVVLLSTKSYASENGKRNMIDNYNKYIGDVDESDEMLYVYLDERRTLKYWKKVVFNIFGRMVLNAYILFSMNSDTRMTKLQFISAIIESIEEKWMKKRNLSETPTSKKSFGLEKLPGSKLRRCVVCSNKDGSGIKRSSLICSACKKGLHGVCLDKHVCG